MAQSHLFSYFLFFLLIVLKSWGYCFVLWFGFFCLVLFCFFDCYQVLRQGFQGTIYHNLKVSLLSGNAQLKAHHFYVKLGLSFPMCITLRL